MVFSFRSHILSKPEPKQKHKRVKQKNNQTKPKATTKTNHQKKQPTTTQTKHTQTKQKPQQKKTLTNKKNVYYGAPQPKYVAAVNLITCRPDSLVLIFLCMDSLGADRRGAGHLDGNSGLRPEFPSKSPRSLF